jgi:4-hydroxymandelate oxidase
MKTVCKAVNVLEFDGLARERLDPGAYDYCSGGADGERTLAENTRAFGRIFFRPNILVDTSLVDSSVTLLGQRLTMPILVAPTAFNRLMHSDGELAVARAAAAVGTLLAVSVMSSTTIEEVAAAVSGPLWFQLYVFRDRALTRALVQRAEAAGYQALVVTVDAPRIGRRERDIRRGFVLPAGVNAQNLAALGAASRWDGASSFADYNTGLLDPALTWDAVDWLRSITTLPIVLKGIMAPDDAARAVAVGAAGIVVSNHGGRQLDGAMATIDALPEIAQRVEGRCAVLLDGGVRRGTDVLAALALGAVAVLVGRPCLWGLAVGGEAGVTRVLELLRDELVVAMGLAGCPTIGSIERSLVARPG